MLTSNLSAEYMQELSRAVNTPRNCNHCVIVSSGLPESDIAGKELGDLLRRTLRPVKCDYFPVAKSCLQLIEPLPNEVCASPHGPNERY